jgi:type IV secretory pathway ATPase VirB11/archaellum biosynthesis ATPase
MAKTVRPPKIVSASEAVRAKTLDMGPIKPEYTGRDSAFDIRPCFTSSWIEETVCAREEIVLEYCVDSTAVRIISPSRASHGIYIVDPPEYRVNPAHMQALADTISEMTWAAPDDLELGSLASIRPYIQAKAEDILYSKLASRTDKEQTENLDRQVGNLAALLCKYTAGFGILEVLFEDPLVQDVYVDAPSSDTPVQVVLRTDVSSSVRQKCRTNIFVGKRDLQGLISRVKFETGLPFSEAHPILEADIQRLDSRVTLIGPPLSPRGVSLAIRKHSRAVWTIPALIANGTLSPLLSSFLWACVIGRRTVLIAGSRGAGKTTLLSSVMLEFPLSQRILLIEDTPEIPARRFQELGFDLQALRFSAGDAANETTARDALRVSLRMGESAIVIGEVRGDEAKVLYESMRAGSAGSAVLGTIHGNSAKGVLDRAVEDLGVSERAFSSTDIVVVIGLVRSPDGSRFCRRVQEIAEVREEGGRVTLVNLFETEPGCLCAKPTASFSPECKTLRGISQALGTRPDKIMEAIKARAYADQLMADRSKADGHDARAPERLRVSSNELLTRLLFEERDPEEGSRKWRAWYDSERT